MGIECVAFRIRQWHPDEPIQVQGQMESTLNWKTLMVYPAKQINSAIGKACELAQINSKHRRNLVSVYNNFGYGIKSYSQGKEYVNE